MAVWVSSTRIPGCRFPPSLPLVLSPCSQQQSSPRVCSPIPTFQLSVPMCTCGHTSQSVVHRAVAWTACVGLTLSCLPQTGHFTLLQQPQGSPSVPNDFPISEGASPDVGTSPLLQLPFRGAEPVLLPLLFFFPSFFHPTWFCRDLSCPFRCPRSSASVQLVFCENCSICRCSLDAFAERDELHVLLLLCHLSDSQ